MLLPTQEDPFTPLRDRWQGKGKAKRDFTCGNVCGRTLGGDKHICAAFCHDDCARCEVRQSVQRWRGKEVKQVWCGVGEPADCLVEGDVCDSGVCARFFDCGIHKCEKPRHRPSPQPSECPPSPSHVTHCPCEKSIIAPSPSAERSQHTFAAAQIPSPLAPALVRIPTRCSHPCQAKCHTGPCLPYTIKITRSCRCGRRRAVFPATKSTTAVLVTTQQKRARSSAIAHARFSRLVVDINVVGCCPLASSASASVKKGKKRVMLGGMDMRLGKSRGDCTGVC